MLGNVLEQAGKRISSVKEKINQYKEQLKELEDPSNNMAVRQSDSSKRIIQELMDSSE